MTTQQKQQTVFTPVKTLMEMMLADDDLFALRAKLFAKMKQSLIAEGFSEEQAIEIIKSQNIISGSPNTVSTTDSNNQ